MKLVLPCQCSHIATRVQAEMVELMDAGLTDSQTVSRLGARVSKYSPYCCLEGIRELVERGGPRPEEYREVDEWIRELYLALDAGRLSRSAEEDVRKLLETVFSGDTMLGLARRKPHGYAGDFEIIDRHYLSYVAPEPQIANWDHYWHSTKAARAVRNRKSYFHELLRRNVEARNGRALWVLDVASGPGRDVFEFLSSSTADVRFDCVDQDPKAIAHATALCAPFDRVSFRQANALRLRPDKPYHLVWGAGLFDYFNDRIFKSVLRRLLSCVAPGGELVIGNFSLTELHANLCWLRLCDWHLHYRDAQKLVALATEAGAPADRIQIGAEPEGVNLFLHIRRDD